MTLEINVVSYVLGKKLMIRDVLWQIVFAAQHLSSDTSKTSSRILTNVSTSTEQEQRKIETLQTPNGGCNAIWC